MERSEVYRINNEIGQCASRKDAIHAAQLFQSLIEAKSANNYSFSNMINVYVMCGDYSRAEEVFNQLRLTKGLSLDIVSCTSLLKAYSKVGNITASQKLLKEMEASKPSVIPNVRTLNTFLRGCIVAGAVDEASQTLTHLIKLYKVTPDVSSWEAIVMLNSQALRVDHLHPILGRIKSDATMLSGLGLMYICLARSCAILMDTKGCRKALDQAVLYLEKTEALERAGGGLEGKDEMEGKRKAVTGGKKGWKERESNNSREQSLLIYQSHRSSELRREVELIKKYAELRVKHAMAAEAALPLFYKTFSFPPRFVPLQIDDTVDGIIAARNIKFGFERFNRLLLSRDRSLKEESAKPQQSRKSGDQKRKQSSLPAAEDRVSLAMKAHMHSCFASSFPLIDFGVLFGNTGAVKLEVGAGAGEWAVAQAAADLSSNYITMELRHDRVYETFTKALLREKLLTNICTMGGNALEIIPNFFPHQSIDHVFVNFPEPPQQTASDLTSQSNHLLNHVNNIFQRDTVLSLTPLLLEFLRGSFENNKSWRISNYPHR